VPRQTVRSWRITSPGVYEDVRVVGGDILVAADNVTLRRVELIGGQISLWKAGNSCYHGLVVEDSSFLPPAGESRGGASDGVIVPGDYTARRIKVQNRIEGLRAGGCGPVNVEDSYIHIDDGGDCKLHADGIQGYGGRGLVVRNVAIDAREMTCGTAPLFYPRNQGNTGPVDINRLWLAGGGYSLRLGVGPASLRGVQILDRSWGYGPVDVHCPAVQVWDVVAVNASGQVVRALSCAGEGT
jgi:hypothetical protein